MARKPIDLRSDTVTQPSAAMRSAMAEAVVGDDVYGEDPTVNRLEETCAERLGFEAGLLLASGTQSNLAALLTHCGRGDEYIAGQDAHTYRYEGGGAAVFGGIQPQPLAFDDDGTLPLHAVEALVKPDDFHYAKTRLLCLENTQAGRAVAAPYFGEARAVADRLGLKLHLDGARLFNASVALGVDATEITSHCDSVSLCLSKGLGAPVGSVLCGTSAFVDSARRWRKVLGGGMRQAGVIAAAGLHALENNVDRLAEDHRRARTLAFRLRGLDLHAEERTNMVFVEATDATMAAYLAAAGIQVSGPRWVIHLDIDDQAIDHVVTAVEGWVRSLRRRRA
ncbi:MAG: low-specificity L-threonine aldolase [Gammaproteobacteria bacterium]|nr:low-specificity L-threonine aldolase [Gammaproteobacteria bacterium]